MSTLILGAGPAGLAAAHELGRRGHGSVVLEKSDTVGGLARTAVRGDFRFDVGGHRFFTRYARVQELWEQTLGDELLVRRRLSRILYRGRLFDYPLKLRSALRGLGAAEAVRCVGSYGRARLRRAGTPAPQAEATFEQWVSGRFGRRLFEIFFRTYTEKVWGIGCDEISADWAAQRIKNLSLGKAVRDALLPGHSGEVTSLIEAFHYPRLGPGQMYEAMADRVATMGSEIRHRSEVVEIRRDGFRVTDVVVEGESGRQVLAADTVLSSIPLTALVEQMRPAAPDHVLAAARSLRFRHLIAVCLVVEGEALFPDNWVYVHSPELRVARIQNQGNWSPAMAPQPGRSALSLEYFTEDGDDLWESSDDELVALAKRELAATELCNPVVVDGFAIRAPRAYPVYERGYEAPLGTVTAWLKRFMNLHAMGRYGMFKYNNSDHSILTALLTVDNLLDGVGEDVWSVNSDERYHEA